MAGNTQTDGQKDSLMAKDRMQIHGTDGHSGRQTYILADRRTFWQTGGQMVGWTDGKTYSQAKGQENIEVDRQTDKQTTDGKTDRQTYGW